MTRGTSKKGPQKKKKEPRLTHCGPGQRPRCSLTSFPGRLFRLVFFFCCGQARTLTHSLTAVLGGDASRRGDFFLSAALAGPGWCFFCCGPARTLTHSLWAGATSARPWRLFFCLRPRRTRRANNKKWLVYYIGSKKTRRGHSKKKNTTSIYQGY